MKRVMIIGQPGSGKSTLARQIGRHVGLPVIHIDHIHWKAGWLERPKDEKTRLCQEAHAGEAWVFGGGHSVTWPERLERSDTLIWLDLPAHVRLKRVFLRSLRYRGRTRPDLPDGCPEQFDWPFFRWIWDTRTSGRIKIEHFVAAAPRDKAVHHLRNAREVRRFSGVLKERSSAVS